jgi:nucleotide-binding universal stress UspA family protein
MQFHSFLVHLDSDAHCAERIEFAIRLAREHDCHLVGAAPTGAAYMPTVPAAAAAQSDLMALAWDALRDQAEAATQRFHDACTKAGFKSFEVVIDERDKADSLIERAHCSDLVILTQDEAKSPLGTFASDLVEQVVLGCARPTLVLPHAGHFDSLSKPALVAWDDSREAARAVSDALPLLRKCESVQVVAWNEDTTSTGEAMRRRLDALQKWLLWHGVTADVRMETASMPIAEAMLSRASDFGTGLIVMGAYGHMRLSERILGGATRGLLQSMTVPVLMSH